MSELRTLTLAGVRKALEVRQRLQIDKSAPAMPFDVAPQLGAQVWLRDASTYDGVYSDGAPPVIVLSSCVRWDGRRLRAPMKSATTLSATALGSTRYCEPDKAGDHLAPEEHVANAFAAHLLMPRSAVVHGLEARNLNPRALAPADVLALSSWLGVGYGTLVTHMSYQLRLIGMADVSRLMSHEPAHVKVAIAPDCHGTQEVVLVDRAWSGRPIDCRVNDFVCLRANCAVDGPRLTLAYQGSHGDVFRATSVGYASCSLANGWTARVRVWRRGKIGRALYIYDEEDGDE